MIGIRLFALAWLLALVLPHAASAQTQPVSGCRLRIEAAVSNWTIRGYDPFGAAPATDEFDITFVNDGTEQCRFRPSFDTDQQPFGLDQGTGPRLVYSLLNRTGGEDVTPRAGRTLASPARPLVVVGPNKTQTVRFGLAVVTDNLVADGTFTQNLRLDAEEEDGGVAASRQLTVGLDVKPAALVGLAGSFVRSEGRALVDLGELKEGIAPVPLSLNVRSTRGFTISFESQNGGALKLQGTEWAIPYSIVVDDRVLALGATADFISASSTELGRRSIPLRFSIGNTAQKRAGLYSDVITVTIAVN